MRRLVKYMPAAGGLSFMIALATVGAGNMGFHVVVSRLLGPAAYGAFGSLLAVLTLMTVPASGFQTLVTARAARVVESGRVPDGQVLLGRALTLGALGTVVMLVASPVIQGLLRLDSIWPALWLALYCIPLAGTVVPWGLLCGRGRFGTVGAIAVTSTVVRLSMAVLFIKAGLGVSGAVAASVVSDGLQALALHIASRRGMREEPAAVSLRLGAKSSVGGVTAYWGLWLLTGIDTIAARQLLDPVASGRYSAAATAVHGALYGAHAISLASLPAFAAVDERNARRSLIRALLITAVLTIPAMVAMTVLSPWLVPLVFGSTFQVPILVIALIACATVQIALLWVLVQYHIARAWRGIGAAWIGIPIAALGAVLWHTGLLSLAVVMLPATAVPLGFAAWWALRRRPAVEAVAGPRMPEPATPVDLTVVVPFYNPGSTLRPNLLNLLRELGRCDISFEIVAVDDGSVDGSGDTIADLDPFHVRRITLPHNQGKGAALRHGLLAGNGRYLGFIDADGDLDPVLWRSFVRLIEMYEPDGVVGDKRHPLTLMDSDASWTRTIFSIGYRSLVRLFFPTLPVRDTQVGLKVFRRDVLADVLPRCVEQRFVLDVEILALASRLGYRRILAAPISLYRVDRTTVTSRSVVRMFADTVRLAWRMQIRDRYRLPVVTTLDRDPTSVVALPPLLREPASAGAVKPPATEAV
jgi:O-antigen/teichoic acid export membrane protein